MWMKTICTRRQCKRDVKRSFGALTTLCEKLRETKRIAQESFTQFLAWRKISKRLFLDPQNFVIHTTLCSKTMAITCFSEMSFWTISYVEQSNRKKPQCEIESPWLHYASKIQGKCVQDEATPKLWNSTQSLKRTIRNFFRALSNEL